MPPDERISVPPSKVGTLTILDWFTLALVIGGALSDVITGELMSGWYCEFSATRKSSSSTSAQNNIFDYYYFCLAYLIIIPQGQPKRRGTIQKITHWKFVKENEKGKKIISKCTVLM